MSVRRAIINCAREKKSRCKSIDVRTFSSCELPRATAIGATESIGARYPPKSYPSRSNKVKERTAAPYNPLSLMRNGFCRDDRSATIRSDRPFLARDPLGTNHGITGDSLLHPFLFSPSFLTKDFKLYISRRSPS